MTEEEERIEMELRRQDRQKARQEEWEKIKGLGWKARAGYLWDYYKFVLVILVFVIVGISIVRTMIIGSMTDMILEVAVLNTDTLASDAVLLREDFTDYLGGLGKHEQIQIDTSVNVVENARSQADMMGDMKPMIAEKAPIINKINPAAVISDSYYCLNMFGTGSRFFTCIIYMAGLSVVFTVVGMMFGRRQSYDSI